MAHAILMPKFGQMTETSVLTLWRKAVGDPVRRGDVLFEIETEKSAMEVEAFDDGVLLARLVAEGEEVPVSTVCGYVGEPGEAVPDAAPAPAAEVAGESPVTERAPRPGAASPATSETGRIRISPRATRLAAELGVDPRTIAGTGPGGRIVERDVTAAAAMADEAAVAAPAPARQAGDDEEAPRPLSRMRRVIAERLTLSATTIPTFTVTVAADVTGLLALRRELRERGSDLTSPTSCSRRRPSRSPTSRMSTRARTASRSGHAGGSTSASRCRCRAGCSSRSSTTRTA